MIYHLGLGSNLDDPPRQLARARTWIERTAGKIRKVSSLYLTEPVGLTDQPWFLNQVIEVASALTPLEMLKAIKSIERRMKRVPGPRNGPRRIDIDILLADKVVLRKALLTIPHPRLAGRNFVLFPLSEIAPRRRHPILGATMATLRRVCPDRSMTIRLPEIKVDSRMIDG
jgi:2-amino-4-hydroxy-6-hydroxymethyldihydropteridine diphosphokinase